MYHRLHSAGCSACAGLRSPRRPCPVRARVELGEGVEGMERTQDSGPRVRHVSFPVLQTQQSPPCVPPSPPGLPCLSVPVRRRRGERVRGSRSFKDELGPLSNFRPVVPPLPSQTKPILGFCSPSLCSQNEGIKQPSDDGHVHERMPEPKGLRPLPPPEAQLQALRGRAVREMRPAQDGVQVEPFASIQEAADANADADADADDTCGEHHQQLQRNHHDDHHQGALPHARRLRPTGRRGTAG